MDERLRVLATELPDKPSDLLEMALGDLARVEADPRYLVNMTTWHQPQLGGDTCCVCLAGAVLTRALRPDEDNESWVCETCDGLNQKLMAINELRAGTVSDALIRMGLDVPDTLPRRMRVVPYETNREQFHEDMRAIVVALREAGL